jgi:hypothetical protein
MKFPIIALSLGLAAAAASPAAAQEPSQQPRSEARAERMDPAKRVERRARMLTERLGLNADQAARVKAILTQEGEQMKAFYEKNRAAENGQRPTDEQRKAFRDQMQQVRERSNAEIAKVLDAAQLKKYEELQKQRRGPRGDRTGRQS